MFMETHPIRNKSILADIVASNEISGTFLSVWTLCVDVVNSEVSTHTHIQTEQTDGMISMEINCIAPRTETTPLFFMIL